MDDIYHKLVFSGKKWSPAYRYTRQDIENTMVLVVNGVSKLYGMTGFRIGWVVASRQLVEVMTNIQAQTTSCTSIVLQAAAEGALTGMQNVVENLRLTIENNCNVILQELKTFTGVRVVPPDGTFYVLPDFSAFSHELGRSRPLPAAQSPPGDRPRQRVRDGRLLALELRGQRQGFDRCNRTHALGFGPEFTQ